MTATLAKIERQIRQLIEAIAGGMYHPSMKGKMPELESRKAALELERDQLPEEAPALLHPGLSELYREKITNLIAALSASSVKQQATEILRSLISEIRMIPGPFRTRRTPHRARGRAGGDFGSEGCRHAKALAGGEGCWVGNGGCGGRI